jgi:putative ABC transport system ATP-binding protein
MCLLEKIKNFPNRRPVNPVLDFYMNTRDLDKPLIRAVGISKNYVIGDNVVHALSDVHFSIVKGELVAIMGPSGSGKTTMMNLLGCLDTPTRGQYYLDGINVSELTPDDLAATRSSKLGFVFQSFNLLARTSALSNVQLPLLYSPIDKIQR